MLPFPQTTFTRLDALNATDVIESEGATIQPEALPALLALVRRVLRVQGMLLAQASVHLTTICDNPVIAALIHEIMAVQGRVSDDPPFVPNVPPARDRPVPGPAERDPHLMD